MSPTVHHTYFGSQQQPLFGALHVPGDGRARGAVVFCAPLGKEQADTTRGQMLLADRLADAGVVALRFDYLHTGESWGDQDDPLASDRLAESLAAAVDLVRSLGIEQIGFVGLRSGAFIASQLADGLLASAPAVLLWDPILRGSVYVRAERLGYQAAFDDESDADEVVHLTGATWHRDAIAGLRGMSLAIDSLGDLGGRVAVASEASASPDVNKLLDAGAEHVEVAPTAPFVRPDSFYVALPASDIDRLGNWLLGKFVAPATAIAPLNLQTDAVMATGADGRKVVTRIERHADGLLVWVTEPTGEARSALIAHSTANDVRSAPARLWVELGRELAQTHGTRTIRYDRPGVGESGQVNSADDYQPLYTELSVRYGREAAESAGELPAVHAGICSGGWIASRLAWERRGADKAVVVNLLTWRLHTRPFHRDDLVRMGLGVTAEGQGEDPSWYYRYRDKLQPIVSRILPFWAWRVLGRLHLAQVPDSLMRRFAHRHVDTRLVFSGQDWDLFVSQRGRRSLSQLRSGGWQPEVVRVGAGDHAGLHWRIRAAVEEVCRHAVTNQPAPANHIDS